LGKIHPILLALKRDFSVKHTTSARPERPAAAAASRGRQKKSSTRQKWGEPAGGVCATMREKN
jgi:hypothetical protein